MSEMPTPPCLERSREPEDYCGNIKVTVSWRPWPMSEAVTSDCDKYYIEECFGKGVMRQCRNTPCEINAGKQCSPSYMDCDGLDYEESREAQRQHLKNERDAWMTTADKACNRPDSWPGAKHDGLTGYRALARQGKMCHCDLNDRCMSCEAHKKRCNRRALSRTAQVNEKNRLYAERQRLESLPICSTSAGYPKRNRHCWGPDRFGVYGECVFYCDSDCKCASGKKCGKGPAYVSDQFVQDCI